MGEDNYGDPLLLSGDKVECLGRVPLGTGDYNEDFVRNLAFEHPGCLPISEIDTFGTLARDRPVSESAVDDEMMKRLEALGYLD